MTTVQTQRKTLRVALFKFPGDVIIVSKWPEDTMWGDGVRISEYVEVEFPVLAEAAVIERQAALVDKSIEKKQRELDELRQQKTDVLSQVFA